MSSYVKLGQHCWTLVIAGKPFLEPVVRAVVVGGNRRKRSSFLGHLLGGLTARLHGKSETAYKVEVQRGFSEVDA
ncbi:hypothetical protein HP398_24940 [Brevibacillus sp. HB1.4B]|uniref:hypothetical protein n=1 Tax=Brevibacillus TaxID=55080 RepID=UPI0003814215|nr:hypothetical protein [Brevibacillus sp. HB1.4B]NRS19673.1 hypothetical protein [Brevibacillus sp. HB1.4B]